MPDSDNSSLVNSVKLSMRDLVLVGALVLGGGGGLAGADQLSELTQEVRAMRNEATERGVRLNVAEGSLVALDNRMDKIEEEIGDCLDGHDLERVEKQLDELRTFHPRRPH